MTEVPLRDNSSDLTCFSESYGEARTKFLGAAAACGAEVHSHKITEDSEGQYFTDVAVVKGSGHGLLVVSSGTHGVEGYAGSGIQISILRQLQGLKSVAGPTLVLVHAVNPFGMAHFRRWNENNVDLNRNALLPQHFEKLVQKDRMQESYNKFDNLFNPTTVPSSLYIKLGSWFVLLWNIYRHGFKALKMALVGATYSRSQGIFFGGQELQRSHVVLRDFMRKRFGDVKASEVGWVDVHTGLGAKGVDVLMGDAADNQDLSGVFPAIPGEFDGFQTLSQQTTDQLIEARCTSRPEVQNSRRGSQSSGYEFTVGPLGRSEWISTFFKPQTGESIVVTQEFGTLPGIAVARALMFENTGFHYDRQNHHRWRAFTRDAFYVRTADWKTKVLRRGHDVVTKMAAQVASRSA